MYYQNKFRKSAAASFEHARHLGFWKRIKRKLRHLPTHLNDFEDWKHENNNRGQFDRGVKAILIQNIVGSLGRADEFDRDFFPLSDLSEERWQQILRLFTRGIDLPPIDVYHTDDGYYVIDGHHRISVSRFLGIDYIDAHIIELHADERGENWGAIGT